MDDTFKIFVDQLRDGHVQEMHERLDPSFLDVHEEDLEFKKSVLLDGEAYSADHELILHWNISAEALVSCSICNDKVPVKIEIENFYHSEPMDEIKSAVYNFKNLLRETILLEVPPFAECQEGNCPQRREVEKYLKAPSENKSDEDEGFRPFADL